MLPPNGCPSYLLFPPTNLQMDVPLILPALKGTANGEAIQDGDLIRGDRLQFDATDDVQLIVMHTAHASN